MKIEIKLYSFWSAGSGKVGGSLDSIVLRDKDNLPYIPGRTFKGLLRDAYNECGYKNKNALFGYNIFEKDNDYSKEDLKKGNLRFNSVKVLTNRAEIIPIAYQLYRTKTAISLDENKQADDGSLRKTEMTIPLTLEVDLHYKNGCQPKDGNSDIEDLESACKMLRFLGEKRHRGLGRCKITIVEENPTLTPEKNTINKTLDLKGETELQFKCKLNEPIILVQNAKTGHNIESLESIPGSIFRGIIAAKLFYSKCDNKKIENIIFNNTVQFEDANLAFDETRSYKLPFSFYKNSKENNKFFNFHMLESNNKIKQNRNGYFIEGVNSNIQLQHIQYGSAIKSSRNTENRTSKDGGLYTHHYLEAEQEFIFSVKSSNTEYLKKIKDFFENEQHFIGQSALAEFGGCIDITLIKEVKCEIETNDATTHIYAESNLCFLNEYGDFTGIPNGEQLTGNKVAVIDWNKSQVKTRRFTPYNGHRNNWDSERLIIEKGSVFVLKGPVEVRATKKGLFQTEGYGNILLNPSFLEEKEIKYTDKTPAGKNSILVDKVAVNNTDSTFLKYLKENHNSLVSHKVILTEAKNYPLKKFKQKKPSQWARVFDATTRSFNKEDLETLLLNQTSREKNCSILLGGSKNWDGNDVKIFEKLLEKENALALIRKIAKNNMKKETAYEL